MELDLDLKLLDCKNDIVAVRSILEVTWLAFVVFGTIGCLISLQRSVIIQTTKHAVISPDFRLDGESVLGVNDERELEIRVQKLVDAVSPGLNTTDWDDILRKRTMMSSKYVDLMSQTVPAFDGTYKNPCWKAPSGQGLHCLPYFYLLGVKKSGTTSLYSLIRHHPEYADPKFKEAQWFPRKRFDEPKYDSIMKYVKIFQKASAKIYSSPKGNLRITGDGTPANLHMNTLWWRLPGNEGLEEPKYVVLDYIHHFLPAARIILIFRDPIDRLYSDYYHEYGRLRSYPRTGPGHFHEVVKQGLGLYKDCFQRFTLRSCVYNNSLYEVTKMQIQLGIYHVYWEDLTRLYPRDQIKIIHNEWYKDNVQTTAVEIFKFLKMRSPTNREWHRILGNQTMNTRSAKYSDQGDMFSATRKLLEDFYTPFNRRMTQLTNDSHFLYTDSAS